MIHPFYGLYDAEAYLDWEMTIDNKFSPHLVIEQHHVRQATSEFKDFAIIWWNELSTLRLQPDTWDRLKLLCVRDLCHLPINVTYKKNYNA
jgi:hypothetical protein